MDRRRLWRLLLASLAFAASAPPSLVGLPFAGLMLAARPRAAREWALVAGAGIPGAMLLVVGAHGLLDGLLGAYVVFVSAAFAVLALVAPARFLRQACRASVLGLGAALALLPYIKRYG